jgi:hypothetical protein
MGKHRMSDRNDQTWGGPALVDGDTRPTSHAAHDAGDDEDAGDPEATTPMWPVMVEPPPDHDGHAPRR